MTDSPEQITQWLDYIFSYGTGWVYAALFFACFIENIFPPFPGDSFIAAAGALVAAGRLEFTPSLALVLCGGMASVMAMYILGRHFGRDFFMAKDYRYFSVEDIGKFEKSLSKWGAWLMIFSRFVVGFRSAIAVGAGIARYPSLKMVIYSLISYILFTGVIFYLAIIVVNNLDVIAEYFQTYNMVVWPIVVLAVTFLIVWRVRKVRARSK